MGAVFIPIGKMTESEITIMRLELQRTVAELREKNAILEQEREANNRLQATLAEMKAEVAEMDEMKAEMDDLRKKVAYYESANMPTSTPSLFNEERKKFRDARKKEEAAGSTNGGEKKEESAAPAKKRGPPMGHKGISHHNKSTLPPKRYPLEYETAVCPKCGNADVSRGGTGFQKIRAANKQIIEMDPQYRGHVFTAVVERAACIACGGILRAHTPFLEGSSMGPFLHGLVTGDAADGLTDERISERLSRRHDLDISRNTIWAGHRALTRLLKKHSGAVPAVIERMRNCLWAGIDEVPFRRGDGKRGYVWLARTPECVFVWFSPSRAADVLYVHLPWLKDRPIVCDGYAAYVKFSFIRQRCWAHSPAHGGGRDKIKIACTRRPV